MMKQRLELYDKDFKPAILKMFQQAWNNWKNRKSQQIDSAKKN